jgi:NTP pyrophosphatase (non-canonical NTP hydrolase)
VREENDIRGLIRDILEFRERRGWAKYHRPKDLAVSLAIEIGELLEHVQWRTDEEIRRYLENRENRTALEEELADVLIYALLLAHDLGSDVKEIVRDKIRKNELKYPADRYRGRAHLDEGNG